MDYTPNINLIVTPVDGGGKTFDTWRKGIIQIC